MRAERDPDDGDAGRAGRPMSVAGACLVFGLCLGILLGVVLAIVILHIRGSL